MPQFENLTDDESKNINTIGLVCSLIIIFMFIVLMFSHFSNNTKHLEKIIYGLSIIYLILVFVTSVMYFSYRNAKSSVSDESDMIVKPFLGFGLGVAIIALMLYITKEVLKSGSADITGKPPG